MEKCKNCGRVVKDSQIYGTEEEDTHCFYCVDSFALKKQSLRMLKDALFFINSIGKQDDFLNYIPTADKNLYLEVWD